MEFPNELNEYTACKYLTAKGYVEARNGFWQKPTPDHRITEDELKAIWYLVEEWDFGGVTDD
jgi:hypothetical protein